MAIVTATEPQRIIDGALCGELDEATHKRIQSVGREAVVLFALAFTGRLAELRDGPVEHDPLAPTGMVPVDTRPNETTSRRKLRARNGHAGATGRPGCSASPMLQPCFHLRRCR